MKAHPKEIEAMRALGKESDRAAAIIAGSMLEDRLLKAIQSYLRQPAPGTPLTKDYLAEMFRPSGPIGQFATKIRLAFLMGLFGAKAAKELEIIKDVRNKFAHAIEVHGFDNEWVKNKVQHLTLIENHLLTVDEFQRINSVAPRPGSYGAGDDAGANKKFLADAKNRYIESCALYGNIFVYSPFPADVPVIFGDDERLPSLHISGGHTLDQFLHADGGPRTG